MSSKYSKKKQQKAPPKAVVAVNEYISTCCNVPATKPALQAQSDWKSAKITDFGGLGKFRCTQCKKRCVVSRSKKTQEVA